MNPSARKFKMLVNKTILFYLYEKYISFILNKRDDC